MSANSTILNNTQLCEDDEGIDSILVDDVNTVGNQGKSNSQGGDGRLVDVAKDILGANISENWLHMDQIEPEKLKWMKKSPSMKESRVCLKLTNNLLTLIESCCSYYIYPSFQNDLKILVYHRDTVIYRNCCSESRRMLLSTREWSC